MRTAKKQKSDGILDLFMDFVIANGVLFGLGLYKIRKIKKICGGALPNLSSLGLSFSDDQNKKAVDMAERRLKRALARFENPEAVKEILLGYLAGEISELEMVDLIGNLGVKLPKEKGKEVKNDSA